MQYNAVSQRTCKAVSPTRKDSSWPAVFRAAFPHTVPIMTGYLVLSLAYGVLMRSKGYGAPWSLCIILLVAAVLRSVLRYAGVQAVLDGVRPCVVAMILATAVTMGLSTLGGYTAGPAGGFAPDGRAIAVFVLLGLVHCGYKKIRQKAPSPIGMILLSAVLGIVFWH